MRQIILGLLFCLLFSQYLFGQDDPIKRTWGNWKTWGDSGYGTFNNPILPADYSDIDCIRVGSSYFAVSSTFQYSPGFIILQSKDLVNWVILSHAVNDLTQISPEMNWDKMNRYGRGIWAGAIACHHHKFYIYFGTPDEGYFMTTAKDPGGPWSPLHPVLSEKGWDDCCPFWDSDGQGYLIGTHFSDHYKIHLFKMTPDGKGLIKNSDKVIHQSKGSEANKLYKINGWYYHLFSEVTKGGRTLMMERSKKITGPYSNARQLSYPQQQFNEPNQGGLIMTEKNDWYFLTHHGTGDWSGRAMSLLPVTWIDGWPIIGKPDRDKIGQMVWSGKMPVKGNKSCAMQTSDEFNTPVLQQQWEWNYQPRADKWSLTERKGWLRLYAFKPIKANDLLKAGNTLTQRSLRTSSNEIVIKFDLTGMTKGEHAGLSHFGSPVYSTVGVVYDGNRKQLETFTGKEIRKGPPLYGDVLWLKSTWGLAGKSQYYYSTDGLHFIPIGNVYQMLWEAYRGDRIAIYNFNNKANDGHIDIDFFHYSYSK